ncbi:MAG: FtsX-like permease family protein [Actinobacteria bacterium]|nr:FtsX-like permease family protein [Actinomycetota bacterium]
MALRTLNSVAARNLARRKGRYLLTASGIALGVAVLFAVQIMSGATNRALDRAIHGGAGKDDVYITPVGSFDASFPPGVFERVQKLPDVESAGAGTGFRSAVTSGREKPAIDSRRPNFVFVNGVDLATDRKVREYDVRDGRLFAGAADEIVLGPHIAKTVGVKVGDDVAVAAPAGQITLKVVGVLADSGIGTGNGGDIAVTSIPLSQRMLGKGAVFTSIDVVLRDGVDAKKWIETQRNALGDGVTMQKATDGDAGFRSFIAAVNGALTLGSAIALFVGGFLIFLTFSLAVAERTRTYGTMRALGALPKQIRSVVVREAALLGLGSSVVGLVLGYALAAAAMQLVSSLLYLRLPGLGLPVGPAGFSIAIGVIISVAAAWLPGRRAARLSPVTAMREGGVADDKAGRPVIGAVLVGLGMALVFALPGNGARVFPTLLVLFGAVMLVPIMLGPLARFLGAVTRRLARGVGAIAVMHLVKERSRSAYTLALVMVVLAMILAVGTSNASMAHTVDKVIERQAGGAVQVGAPGALDPAVERELTAIDGVKATTPMRFGQLDVVETGAPPRQFFTMIDPATYFSVGSFPWVDGNDGDARDAMTAGSGIILPEQQAIKLDVKRGGPVRVRTSAGVKRFTLVGTFGQIGNFPGPVLSVKDAALFGAGRPNGFLLSVAGGRAGIERVRRTILTNLKPRYNVEVDTSQTIKDQARAQLQGFFALAYALLFVAALVGILGLANTMVVSVLSRTREVGMLRSTGTLRRQARAMVLVEASTLALVAYLLALPLGWLLSTGIVVSQRATLGFSIDYVFPWLLVPALVILTVLVAAVGSLIPARRIGRLEIVDALRFD